MSEEAQLSARVRSEAELAAWLDGGGLRGVASLILWDAQLTDAAALAIAGDPHAGALRALDLSWNRIGAAGAAALARMPGVRRLRVYHNDIGVDGAVAIAAAGGELESLNVCGNALGDAGLAALAAGGLANLRELAIGWNDVGEDGVAALVAAPWPHLAMLNIRCNRLGARSAAALASGALPALKQLGIDENQLGAPGLAALVDTPGFARLTWLNLGGTELNDAAVAAAWPFDAPCALRELRVHDNELSGATIARLARAVPDVRA
jgi:hypothetical protein